MSRVVFVLFPFAFVQMVKSQTHQCVVATEGLFNNIHCEALLDTFDPLLCTSQMCDVLVDSVLTDCGGGGSEVS